MSILDQLRNATATPPANPFSLAAQVEALRPSSTRPAPATKPVSRKPREQTGHRMRQVFEALTSRLDTIELAEVAVCSPDQVRHALYLLEKHGYVRMCGRGVGKHAQAHMWERTENAELPV